MKNGISPIVSVVLLVAIAVVAAVGLFFWAGGLATQQPTPETPITITATPITTSPGELGLLIANLGEEEIPAGTTFYTTSGSNHTLDSALPAGEQMLLTFWGRSDGSTVSSFGGRDTVYGARVAAVDLNLIDNDPTTTGPINWTGGDSNLDISGGFMQDSNGRYWMTYYTNGSPYEVYVVNSSSPANFDKNDAVNVSRHAAGNDEYPKIIEDNDQMYWVVFTSDRDGDYDIYVSNSTDGSTWSAVAQVDNSAGTDTEPWVMQDSNDVYWIAWRNGNDIYLRNSTDGGVTWNTSFVAYSGRVPSNPTMIEDNNNRYWIVAGNDTSRPLVIMNSTDANSWGTATDIDGTAVAATKNTNGYLFQDSDGQYVLAFQGNPDLSPLCEGARRVYTVVSNDGSDWGYGSRVSDEATSADEMVPAIMQDGNGTYWIAYTVCNTGVEEGDIVIRSSTDPLIWT